MKNSVIVFALLFVNLYALDDEVYMSCYDVLKEIEALETASEQLLIKTGLLLTAGVIMIRDINHQSIEVDIDTRIKYLKSQVATCSAY